MSRQLETYKGIIKQLALEETRARERGDFVAAKAAEKSRVSVEALHSLYRRANTATDASAVAEQDS